MTFEQGKTELEYIEHELDIILKVLNRDDITLDEAQTLKSRALFLQDRANNISNEILRTCQLL